MVPAGFRNHPPLELTFLGSLPLRGNRNRLAVLEYPHVGKDERQMPLVIEERDNLSCPLIRCDHCAEEINPASDGNYQWRHVRRTDNAVLPRRSF